MNISVSSVTFFFALSMYSLSRGISDGDASSTNVLTKVVVGIGSL